MVKKFKETSIPELYSKLLAENLLTLRPEHVDKIYTVLFDAVTEALAKFKDQTAKKGIVFRTLDGTFIAGAAISYIGDGDADSASGQWNYSWTTDEKDFEDVVEPIDIRSNGLMGQMFGQVGFRLYSFKFVDSDVISVMMNLCIETIINWLRDNVKDGEPVTLELEGVFSATAEVVDGEIEIGIVPDGKVKQLIKDDLAIAN